MCIAKVGKVVEIKGNKALVKFDKKIEKIDISLIRGVKVKDKIVCSGRVAIERVEE
ncbi:MAG: HypC/HybG/HupF family hydrogenase formation chaperone [Candidatus Aenigmarchaeota archaeon]|nr:HypC/HybG/HupF family hydrogenase formation chaperone [Candidatus Aenigmarchaeota archaeon]